MAGDAFGKSTSGKSDSRPCRAVRVTGSAAGFGTARDVTQPPDDGQTGKYLSERRGQIVGRGIETFRRSRFRVRNADATVTRPSGQRTSSTTRKRCSVSAAPPLGTSTSSSTRSPLGSRPSDGDDDFARAAIDTPQSHDGAGIAFGETFGEGATTDERSSKRGGVQLSQRHRGESARPGRSVLSAAGSNARFSPVSVVIGLCSESRKSGDKRLWRHSAFENDALVAIR